MYQLEFHPAADTPTEEGVPHLLYDGEDYKVAEAIFQRGVFIGFRLPSGGWAERKDCRAWSCLPPTLGLHHAYARKGPAA